MAASVNNIMKYVAADATNCFDETCPICLNDMLTTDTLHPIPCPTACNFNFCINCLTSLLASSKDDYEMASDGNRHVKVRLICPNCRSDISGSIEDTIRMRRKGLSAELQKVPDSELSAKELQLKYWQQKDQPVDDKAKTQQNGANPPEIDPTLFGGLEFAMTEEEQKYVTQLMTSGYSDQLCQAAQILSGIAELVRKGKCLAVLNRPNIVNAGDNSSTSKSAAANTARMATALQAANSNANNMRHGYSNAGVRTNRSRDEGRKTHVSNFQRQMEEKAREKLRRPLPARMPLCVTLSTVEFEKMALRSQQQVKPFDPFQNEHPRSWLMGIFGRGSGAIRGGATMTFVDDEWDGSVADAFARARVSTGLGNHNRTTAHTHMGSKNPIEKLGVQKILAMAEQEDCDERRDGMPPLRSQRVLVGSVRGQAGKSGIMKGDVITHVNGEVFTGGAADLNALLVNAYEEQGTNGVVTIVVNAEECTAEALRLRSRMR